MVNDWPDWTTLVATDFQAEIKSSKARPAADISRCVHEHSIHISRNFEILLGKATERCFFTLTFPSNTHSYFSAAVNQNRNVLKTNSVVISALRCSFEINSQWTSPNQKHTVPDMPSNKPPQRSPPGPANCCYTNIRQWPTTPPRRNTSNGYEWWRTEVCIGAIWR